MEDTRMLRRVSWCLTVSFIFASASSSLASEAGAVAAALVEQSSYRHYLDDELYTHYGDDRWFGPEHDLARDNIALIMTNLGLIVTLEPFEYNSATYYNVVGTKLGTLDDSVEYVIGAHYDSINYNDPELGAPGADDNASGVALVLEAARVLNQYESDYTIRFVAFDREEQGLHGAWAYALDHIAENIQAMISADMVAYNIGTDSVDVLFTRSESVPLMEALGEAVEMYGEGLNWQSGGGGSSDHAPFENVGFQACLLIEDWGNPCYHRGCDSVDNPGYIDYDLATRIARTAVGFLADHAGVHVDIPDADYTGDGNVDLTDYAEFDACYTGPGNPIDPGCGFFDIDGDGEIDCSDWRLFKAVWTDPIDPPVFWGCTLPAPIAIGQSGRSIVVTAPEHTRPLALLVEGDSTDPAVSCVADYVQADGRLGPNPVFQTHDVWGTLTVSGGAIVPETAYIVSCDYGELGLSPKNSTAFTTMWGDVVGDFFNDQWTPANGTVDFNDISAVVDAFRNLPTAPPLSWSDLVGALIMCDPEGVIDFNDIGATVDAFKGNNFSESTGCLPPCD